MTLAIGSVVVESFDGGMPTLGRCRLQMKALRKIDTLAVWKLDRLGRDLRNLINTVHDLTARSVGLKALSGHGGPSTRRLPQASWSLGASHYTQVTPD